MVELEISRVLVECCPGGCLCTGDACTIEGGREIVALVKTFWLVVERVSALPLAVEDRAVMRAGVFMEVRTTP